VSVCLIYVGICIIISYSGCLLLYMGLLMCLPACNYTCASMSVIVYVPVYVFACVIIFVSL
jgi:hypothetical protein